MKTFFTFWPRRRILWILALALPCALGWMLVAIGSWRPRELPVQGNFGDIAFSPKEPLLALTLLGKGIVPQAREVQMWNTRTRQLQWRRKAQKLDSLAFSPDGALLASVSISYGLVGDASWPVAEHLLVWDAHTGKQVKSFPLPPPENNQTHKLQFSPDGRTLVTSIGRRTFYFQDLATGRRRTLRLPTYYTFTAKRPVTRRLTPSLRRSIRKWWSGNVLRITPDTKTMVMRLSLLSVESLSRKSPVVRSETWICDAQGRLQHQLPQLPLANQEVMAISRDSRLVALCDSYQLTTKPNDLFVWDIRSARPMHRFRSPQGWRFDSTSTDAWATAVFSADGTQLFTVLYPDDSTTNPSKNNKVVQWDLASGRIVRTLQHPSWSGSGLALSGDGATLALTYGVSEFQQKAILWRVK